MYTYTDIDRSSIAEFYAGLAKQAEHLMEGEPNWIANLSNVSALLSLHLPEISWAGFYLWDGAAQELVLGPFQGKPACIRIPYGKGVCGTALESGEATVIADVFEFPGHIACDPDSRSEVVIPLIRDGVPLGVLDIDAPVTNRFTKADADGLALVARAVLERSGL